MKTTAGLFFSVLLTSLAVQTYGQTLQFTGIKANLEGAIRLQWASQSNQVYQVQCTDALAGNEDGTTAWRVLYDNYPSHGTNTFWLDTGDYFADPVILHPKAMPMRFYQIVNVGADTTNKPSVSVSSPTNGAALSGDVTVLVSAVTDQSIIHTKLYVDGEEMRVP